MRTLLPLVFVVTDSVIICHTLLRPNFAAVNKKQQQRNIASLCFANHAAYGSGHVVSCVLLLLLQTRLQCGRQLSKVLIKTKWRQATGLINCAQYFE